MTDPTLQSLMSSPVSDKSTPTKCDANDIDVVLEGVKNTIMGAGFAGFFYYVLNEVPLFSFPLLCLIVVLILMIIISCRSAKAGDDQ